MIVRYGPPPGDLPGQFKNSTGPDRQETEAAVRRMSQGSQKPVLLPDDTGARQDTEQTIVRARQSKTKPTKVNRRQQGAVFFFFAED